MKKFKKIYITLILLTLSVIIGYVVFMTINAPLSKEELNVEIRKELNNIIDTNPEIPNVLLSIYSNKLNLNQSFAVGKTTKDSSETVTVNHPYHSASIGKTFTATLIGILCDEGYIKYEDPISMYLDENILDGLFVFNGVDYKNQVKVKQLLNHTSGAADYFEDPVNKGNNMISEMKTNKDKFWSPTDLIYFSKYNQKVIDIPGRTFHYSNTGYILLGLIIEKVTKQEFHEVLHKKI